MSIPEDAITRENEVAKVLQQATAEAEAQGDDSGSSMSFGEKKLLLRHRDSFIMNRTHLAEHHGHGGEEGDGVEYVGGGKGLAKGFEASGGEEGGPEGGDYTLNPVQGMEEEGGRGGGAGLHAIYASPRHTLAPSPSTSTTSTTSSSSSSSTDTDGTPLDGDSSPRRKSKVYSFIKGVASALGLRASKKVREGRGVGGAGSPGGAGGPSSPRSSSFSSPGGFSPPYAGAGQVDAEGFYKGEYDPPRDETGSFVPTHRLHPGPRSILKATPGRSAFTADLTPRITDYSSEAMETARSAKASSRSASAAAAAAAAAGSGATPRKGLTFADQHGHELQEVRFSERLHYSGGPDTVNWEEKKACVIV